MYRHCLFFILFSVVIGAGMVGCKTTQPVVPVYHNSESSNNRIEYIHDTLYKERWHDRWYKGDTVYIYDSVFLYKWRDKVRHDSVYVYSSDTISAIVEVEKKGSRFLRNSGIALWIIIIAVAIATLIGIILKFAK